jgi:uncharacterized protein (TIGR03067 family)
VFVATFRSGLLIVLVAGAIGGGLPFAAHLTARDEPGRKTHPAPEAAPPETADEVRKKLQGTYGIDLRSSTPEKTEATFTLDTKAAPKTIKLTDGIRLEGPRTRAPADTEAIFKIEGDVLTLAFGKKGLPKTFKSREGDGVIVVTLKREGRRDEKPDPNK